ncbi:hypothetical protein MMC13_006927 [Lambiella insularis]|nr:hypothetical protein [Lambiella insularis]
MSNTSALGDFQYPPDDTCSVFNYLDSVNAAWAVTDENATNCDLSLWNLPQTGQCRLSVLSLWAPSYLLSFFQEMLDRMANVRLDGTTESILSEVFQVLHSSDLKPVVWPPSPARPMQTSSTVTSSIQPQKTALAQTASTSFVKEITTSSASPSDTPRTTITTSSSSPSYTFSSNSSITSFLPTSALLSSQSSPPSQELSTTQSESMNNAQVAGISLGIALPTLIGLGLLAFFLSRRNRRRKQILKSRTFKVLREETECEKPKVANENDEKAWRRELVYQFRGELDAHPQPTQLGGDGEW